MPRRRITITDSDDEPRRRNNSSDPVRKIALLALIIFCLYAANRSCHPVARAQQSIGPNTSVQEVLHRLKFGPAERGVQAYAMPDFRLQVVTTTVVNAQTNVAAHMIYLNSALLEILGDNRGELAFFIAHEMGHIQDSNCHARGAAHRLAGVALQRMCESAADEIGMQYIIAAGYSPYDAAGAMGRVLMVDPAQSSVLGIVVGRYVSDHPVDVDRIRRMAIYARQTCQDRPEICRQ